MTTGLMGYRVNAKKLLYMGFGENDNFDVYYIYRLTRMGVNPLTVNPVTIPTLDTCRKRGSSGILESILTHGAARRSLPGPTTVLRVVLDRLERL